MTAMVESATMGDSRYVENSHGHESETVALHGEWSQPCEGDQGLLVFRNGPNHENVLTGVMLTS